MASYEEELVDIINNNLYINKCASNKKRDYTSLSYIIDIPLSQSECIRLGIGIERVMTDIITKYCPSFINIRHNNRKGVKETDHLFMDNETKTIYYAELKANVNLDTEKTIATIQKCKDIYDKLKKDYPTYTIKWCLLAYRFISSEDFPITIQKKFVNIKDHLFGVNEYMKLIGVPITLTKETHKKLMNDIAKKMFSNS